MGIRVKKIKKIFLLLLKGMTSQLACISRYEILVIIIQTSICINFLSSFIHGFIFVKLELREFLIILNIIAL
jgi:hypothetical protein